MEYFFLIIGSITVIVTTGIIIKNINDKKQSDIKQKEAELARQRALLINNAIEQGNISDLLSLKEQQISLSEEQKLQMLVNAYSLNNESVISYLKEVNYKLSLSKIIALFLNKKDPAQLQFFLINFLDKKFLNNISPSLKDVIAELFSKNSLDVISLLLEIYPVNTLNSLFLLVEHDKNKLAFQYITNRTQWLQENSSVLNEINFGTDIGLINFLLKVFPNGELGITKLGTLITDLIKNEIDNHDLYTQLCRQMNDARTRGLQPCWAGYSYYLKDIIDTSIYKNRLDVLELIIQSNRDFLSENTDEAAKIIAIYVLNPKISEIFLRNGINVNRKMPDNVSIVERCVIDNERTNEENQFMLDMLLSYGLDLNTKIVKSKPNKIDEITLLGYLVFTSLVVRNNPDFNALRLQKYMAMFFDIPGTSYSNGTLCVHEHMRDSNAHWNYLLDLYFKNLEPTSLTQELPESMRIPLNQCLKTLYSPDGTYDTQFIYDMYQKGDPIILPVNLRGFWGEAHIATVGFMKINPYYHLRVEADRGLGRNDFSIFIEPVFSPYALSQYTRNRNSAIPLEELWQNGPSTKNHILTIPIGEQKSNSCPSTSAKYAFHIAYFLCEIHNRNFSLAHGYEDQRSLLKESYQMSKRWFDDFLASTQLLLLHNYKELDSKYIDADFLVKVGKELTNYPSDLINESSIHQM
ncbi:MAG: hypothetical protein J0I93_11260 [Legionella sp.]|nr:hypothetical protein [Legionella sp.]